MVQPLYVYDEEQLTSGSKFKVIKEDLNDFDIEDENNKNLFVEIPGSSFEIRSETYFQNKKKTPSKSSLLQTVGFCVILSPIKITHVAENLSSLKAFLSREEYRDKFFFIVSRIVPFKANSLILAITIATQKTENNFPKILDDYLNNSEDYKNKRFKYIPRIDKANRTAMFMLKFTGGIRPVILGNGYIAQEHFRGNNYYEVDVDIYSSFVARKVSGIILGNVNGFEISECFLIEGQEEEELPERVLFGNTLKNLDLLSGLYELTEEDKVRNS
eukprot:snap_masked-scaffold_3-processed-gene-12.39-mRNA-1 protein AED:0.95 eAED:1.00 QI:0/-1/0/1/-1/1/1/0/272